MWGPVVCCPTHLACKGPALPTSWPARGLLFPPPGLHGPVLLTPTWPAWGLVNPPWPGLLQPQLDLNGYTNNVRAIIYSLGVVPNCTQPVAYRGNIVVQFPTI